MCRECFLSCVYDAPGGRRRDVMAPNNAHPSPPILFHYTPRHSLANAYFRQHEYITVLPYRIIIYVEDEGNEGEYFNKFPQRIALSDLYCWFRSSGLFVNN